MKCAQTEGVMYISIINHFYTNNEIIKVIVPKGQSIYLSTTFCDVRVLHDSPHN